MPDTWVQDAAKEWAREIGLIPFGRIGKALRPLVDMVGYDQVGVWLRTYLQLAPYTKRDGSLALPEEQEQVLMANIKWITPEAFVQTYRVWAKMSEQADVS